MQSYDKELKVKIHPCQILGYKLIPISSRMKYPLKLEEV